VGIAGGIERRTVLVTGAARGIGNAVARLAAGSGAQVVACDVRPEVRELERAGVTTYLADAASTADMGRVVDAVAATGRRIDAVVANAGQATMTPRDASLDEAVAVFDRMMEANARTTYVTVLAATPQLGDGGGDVVIVSTDHVMPRPGSASKAGFMECYDAGKWALEGLRRNWAVTLGRHGVRVNTVAMGETDTPMLREFLTDRGTPAERIEAMARGWMSADEVAGVIVALLADDDPARTDTTIGLWPGQPVELPPLPAG
jgi:NAD(P)-dependent dehydrogenase (short-subunit alcohol dehydrogenase family)